MSDHREQPLAREGVLAPGTVIAGKYEIEGLLGTGGMGAVYSAKHLVIGKRVALKWLLPSLAGDAVAVARFLREARAAAAVDHPNVIVIHDVGMHDGSLFLVMEVLSGRPLSSWLARGRMQPSELLALVVPALRGLRALHEHGVLHRDVKPDNIFVCDSRDGLPRTSKILDLGIVRPLDAVYDEDLTRTGNIVGTPYYMSPEQLAGADDLDTRADIYSVGVVLYEALAGARPYEANNLSALVVQVTSEAPRSLRELRPDLPHELTDVVMQAFARERTKRISSVSKLIERLEAVSLRPEAPTPPPGVARSNLSTSLALAATLPGPATRAARRNRALWGAGLAAGLTIAAMYAATGEREAPASDSPRIDAPPATESVPPVEPETLRDAGVQDDASLTAEPPSVAAEVVIPRPDREPHPRIGASAPVSSTPPPDHAADGQAIRLRSGVVSREEF